MKFVIIILMKEIVYGPVKSWRFGKSLGINLLGEIPRICTFSCIYCELGKEGIYENERRIFVPTDKIIHEFKKHLRENFEVITFSGAGEPTLARNIKEVSDRIREIKKDIPQVLLTNSTLLNMDEVIEDILSFNIIDCKLDAVRKTTFEKINKPMKGITLENVINGIEKLRRSFKGILSLQIMVLPINIGEVKEISEIVKEINPDEVHLNTPTRPPWKKPVEKEKLIPLKELFYPLKVRTPYD